MPEIVGDEAERMYELAFPDEIELDSYDESGQDRYGNPIPTPGGSTTIGALVVPMDATEEEIGRDTRVSRYHVTTRPDVTIEADDSVGWEGKTLEVVGDPLHTSREGLRRLTFTAREITG